MDGLGISVTGTFSNKLCDFCIFIYLQIFFLEIEKVFKVRKFVEWLAVSSS
jgi:hypothetical protein